MEDRNFGFQDNVSSAYAEAKVRWRFLPLCWFKGDFQCDGFLCGSVGFEGGDCEGWDGYASVFSHLAEKGFLDS